MNALLVGYKPPFISSNAFLTTLKKKYATKKGGFSGTLDPFARGCLIIALGQYTKLLPFLQTQPKVYNATLWLGAQSRSLDIENFLSITKIPPLSPTRIYNVLSSLQGDITYTPPLFSAKKISGKRAYTLAREHKQIQLKEQIMHIFKLSLLNYNHPFLHFQVQSSKGAYIRSLAEIIATKLGTFGTLSALERISEGGITPSIYQEIFLHPFDILPFGELSLDSHYVRFFHNGVKFRVKNIKSGIYKVKFDGFFSIIRVQDDNISYLLNRINYARSL